MAYVFVQQVLIGKCGPAAKQQLMATQPFGGANCAGLAGKAT